MPSRKQAVRHAPPESGNSRPFGWFTGGAVFGAIALVALQAGGLVRLPQPPVVEQAGAEAAGSHAQTRTHEFEFWTRLPESEVVVPDVPEYASGSKSGESVSPVHYILQAGSFRRLADADRLRAELTLLGLDVQIEKVTMDHGDVWHRVQTGPYQNRREVSAARNRLAKSGIEVMVLRRSAPP